MYSGKVQLLVLATCGTSFVGLTFYGILHLLLVTLLCIVLYYFIHNTAVPQWICSNYLYRSTILSDYVEKFRKIERTETERNSTKTEIKLLIDSILQTFFHSWYKEISLDTQTAEDVKSIVESIARIIAKDFPSIGNLSFISGNKVINFFI